MLAADPSTSIGAPNVAWAKLHTDIIGDEKLLRAARKGAKHLHWLPWLIAVAKRAEDGGRLTVGGEAADPEDIAPLIPGGTVKSIAGCLSELEAIGVLCRDTDNALAFANWERRSGGKPSDDPDHIRDRVKRFREKKKRDDVTPGNALHETRRNAIEVEVEVDAEVEKEVEPDAERVSSAFADAWALYPPRSGANSRHDAERNWNARIRDGESPSVMRDGTARYAAFCEANGSAGTQFVMQGSRFYGAGRFYSEAWQIPNAMPAMYEADGVTYTAEWLAWADRTKPNGARAAR